MCVCKLHFHVRWAIEALLKLTKGQNIDTQFLSYDMKIKLSKIIHHRNLPKKLSDKFEYDS